MSDNIGPQEVAVFRSVQELLADESVAVALAVLLAVILVLISVCTVLVWLMGLRRRQAAEKALQQEEKNRTVGLHEDMPFEGSRSCCFDLFLMFNNVFYFHVFTPHLLKQTIPSQPPMRTIRRW